MEVGVLGVSAAEHGPAAPLLVRSGPLNDWPPGLTHTAGLGPTAVGEDHPLELNYIVSFYIFDFFFFMSSNNQLWW